MFFVPIYSNNANAVLLGAGIGQIIAVLGAYELFISPSITKKIKYDTENKEAIFKIKTKHTSREKIIFENGNCLYNKGYRIHQLRLKYSPIKFSLVNQNIPKERFIEQVKNDCKECNFYTILKYKYDTIFLNKKKAVKNFTFHRFLY